jgi:hypothetical protein
MPVQRRRTFEAAWMMPPSHPRGDPLQADADEEEEGEDVLRGEEGREGMRRHDEGRGAVTKDQGQP